VVIPADIGKELLLIGIRGSNHHAATLRGAVLCVVASCMQVKCNGLSPVWECQNIHLGHGRLYEQGYTLEFAAGPDHGPYCCDVGTDRYSLSDSSVDLSVYIVFFFS